MTSCQGAEETLTLNKVMLSLDNKAIATLLKLNDAQRWNKQK